MNITKPTLEQEKPEELVKKPSISQKNIQATTSTADSYSSNTTIYSCSPSNSTKYSQQQKCQHLKIIKHQNYDNCAICGILVPRNGSRNYKSKATNYTNFFSSQTIFESLVSKSLGHNQENNIEYTNLRSTYIDWIFELTEKLKISINTSHLAIYLLDIFMFKDTQYNSQLQLFAPVALLVAAKAMELDERIPFISKLRRAANPIFSVEEFRRAELTLLQALEWNPIYATNLEILEFYLTQGIVNSNDEIETEICLSNYSSNGSHSSNNTASDTPIVTPTYPLNTVLKERNTQTVDTQETIVRIDQDHNPKITNHQVKENNENAYGSNNLNAKTNAPSKTSSPLTKVANLEEVHNDYTNQDTESEESVGRSVLKKKGQIDDLSMEKKPDKKIEKINEDKVDDIISKIERDLPKLATLLIKDNDFLPFDAKILAASSIAFLRKLNKFVNPWNAELEAFSSLKYQNLTACLDIITKKFEQNFQIAYIMSSSRSAKHIITSIGPISKSACITPTTKQENICTELKLFSQACTLSKPGYEIGSHEINGRSNPYATYIHRGIDNNNSIGYEHLVRENERKIFNFQPTNPVNIPITKGGLNGYGLREENAYKSSIYLARGADYQPDYKYYNLPSTINNYNFNEYQTTTSASNPTTSRAMHSENQLQYASAITLNNASSSKGNTAINATISGTSSNSNLCNQRTQGLFLNEAHIKSEYVQHQKPSGILSARNINTKVNIGLYSNKQVLGKNSVFIKGI